VSGVGTAAGIRGPYGLAVVPATGLVYVTSHDGFTIQALNPDNATLSWLAGSGAVGTTRCAPRIRPPPARRPPGRTL